MKEHINRNEYFGEMTYDIKNHKTTITQCKRYSTDLCDQNIKYYLSAPTSVFLELVNKCNLNCRHCFNGGIRDGKLLTIETWKQIIDQLVDMKVFFVKITGGEPFLLSLIHI